MRGAIDCQRASSTRTHRSSWRPPSSRAATSTCACSMPQTRVFAQWCLCPSNIYGSGTGLNPRSVQIPFLVDQARETNLVRIVGQGVNRWSNVHIEDVAELYLLALRKAPAGAFYFIENGEASFAEIGAAIARR